MATQDVINSAVTQLQALATPSANSAQIATVQAQIASLQSQLIAAQQQLTALQGTDGQTALQVLMLLQQVLPNRVPGITVTIGPSAI